MLDQTLNRPPRIRPRWLNEAVELPAPPDPPTPPRVDLLPMLVPLAGAGIFAGTASLNGGNPLLIALPTGSMALLSLGAALIGQRNATRRSRASHAERCAVFEDLFEAGRSRLRRLHEQERSARHALWPDPAELLLLAGATAGDVPPEPRLWERRPDDDDFLDLRVGIGSLPAASRAIVPAPSPSGSVDRRLFRTAAEYATLQQVPISLPLTSLGSLGLAGPMPAITALARAMLWQAVTLHAPADLRLAYLGLPANADQWEWLRWLPHSVPFSNDPAPSARMLACHPLAASRLASTLLDQLSRRREQQARSSAGAGPGPRLLLLLDDPALIQRLPALDEVLRHGPSLGLITLLLAPSWPQLPESCGAMLSIEEYGARWVAAGGQWPRERFTPDQADLAQSDRLARRLAGLRLAEAGGAQAIPRRVRLFDLLGLSQQHDWQLPPGWREPPTRAWHPDVPIGAGLNGAPICLDLNEGQHGPHGIIAGATGAGKSVLLQSLLAAMVATHAPERLQLLLIDFKGGAALMLFAPLPHTTGLVTDLEGRMAERAMIAIKAELRRRKTVLATTATSHTTKVEHIGDYRTLAARVGLPPLPNLLIVVDEFDELARSNPAFVTELIRVVKQGRSLGVHLLLATQQPARVVSDEIRSQLSFFLALRLGGADDSREMLLTPDAAFLPTDLPGRAYLRAGGKLQLLQVAQVTAPYRSPTTTSTDGPQVSFLQHGHEQVLGVSEPDPASPTATDLDVLVRALMSIDQARDPVYPGWRPHQIWQPPLPAQVRLVDLKPQPDPSTWLCAPVGLLDLPQSSQQRPYLLDLASGHLAVIGTPSSGKTTLLRTLALSLGRTHGPAALWIYLLDAGGQGLSSLSGLPQVGAHLQAREGERVRRLLRMLDAAIRERQELLRSADLPDLPAYRARHADAPPAILLIVDKLAVLREELRDPSGDEPLLEALTRLARLGRPLGLHLVISADRASDLSYRLLGLCEHRVVLRQAELHDYSDLLGTQVTGGLPAGLPGRALVLHGDDGSLELQVALPEIVDAPGSPLDQLTDDPLRASVAALAAQWASQTASCQPPATVELLPERISLAHLEAVVLDQTACNEPPGHWLCAPLGRESAQLGIAWLHLSRETPHALICGPRRSGKTRALLTLAAIFARRYAPTDLGLYLIDGPRGGLSELRSLAATQAYANDDAAAADLLAMLVAARAVGAPSRRLILLDDYHLARERMRSQLLSSYGDQPRLIDLLNEITQLGGQQGEHLVLTAGLSYADDSLLRALDGGRAGLILGPGRYEPGTRLLGVSLPLPEQRGLEQPAGRGILVHEDETQLIQVAS
ncbi:MAG: FtsK/SpoIIIE domain-containing protein [Oscillochloridaceae bacterium umkhey_bin13]